MTALVEERQGQDACALGSGITFLYKLKSGSTSPSFGVRTLTSMVLRVTDLLCADAVALHRFHVHDCTATQLRLQEQGRAQSLQRNPCSGTLASKNSLLVVPPILRVLLRPPYVLLQFH